MSEKACKVVARQANFSTVEKIIIIDMTLDAFLF